VSVEQKDVIDFISVDKNNNIVLTISDHMKWDDERRHLLLLQEKINAYLRFIETGEMYEHYPKDKDKNVIIHVVCANKIDLKSMKIFEVFQNAVRDAGFMLTIEHAPAHC